MIDDPEREEKRKIIPSTIDNPRESSSEDRDYEHRNDICEDESIYPWPLDLEMPADMIPCDREEHDEDEGFFVESKTRNTKLLTGPDREYRRKGK